MTSSRRWVQVCLGFGSFVVRERVEVDAALVADLPEQIEVGIALAELVAPNAHFEVVAR